LHWELESWFMYWSLHYW